jgi:putative glutamine amidotransferase
MLRGSLRARVNVAYLRALEGAGVLPLVTAPMDDVGLAARMLERVDGLVLTGGEDVDPRHYRAQRHSATEEPHPARDAWELALVAAARTRRTPILAVCRGLQLLNVALGGTLVQDIPTERRTPIVHADSTARRRRVHPIAVEADSRLAGGLGAMSLTVNSSHHQSLDRIAPSLRATAWAPDGIVEGAETTDSDWWVVGAQWHPEELVTTPESWDRNLFSAFALAAANAARSAPFTGAVGQRAS